MSSRRKYGKNIFPKSKKRICNTANSHVNSSKSNNLNKLNSDNVIVNSNLPSKSIETKSSFNTLMTLQKETYAKSSVSVNDKINNSYHESEDISLDKDSSEVIDNTCDDNGINLFNT